MQLSEEHDRLIDVLLQEVLGGEAPPDLADRIVARAFARPSRVLGRLAAAAAGLLLGVLGWWLLSGGYPEPRASGSYIVVGGGEAQRGSTIHTEDKPAKLTLGGYCRVELDSDTTLQIEGKERAEQVALERGGVLCEVNRAAGAFEVRTEMGTVSVKGTRFAVRVIEGHGGEAMVGKRMWVRVLAGVVLASGAWGQTALRAGEERTLPERKTERERPPEKPRTAALPEGILAFRGYLIGNLLSVGTKGCTVEVASVRPREGNKARNLDCLVGQKVPIHFAASRGPDGAYHPNNELAEAAARQLKKGGLCTLRVRADGDEALVVDRIWAGAQAYPEGERRPEREGDGERKREIKGEGQREPERRPEGERKREGEPKREGKAEGERTGDLDQWLEGKAKREGEVKREGEGEPKREIKGEGEREPERKRETKAEAEREAERKRKEKAEAERKREAKEGEGEQKEGDRNDKEKKNEDTNF